MDQRRIVSRFIGALGTGTTVICGNSMGGAVGVLEAAIEPQAVDGLVLTASVFPWVKGGRRPHPAVMAAFAMYELPAVGERFVDTRIRHVDAERMVRLGFRMVAADPATVPDELMAMEVDLARTRASDPDAPRAFLEATRSMLRLGRIRNVAARTFDRVRSPVLVLHGRRDRLVPVTFAEGALEAHPSWRGRIFPDLGHVPQIEAPGRWLSEVSDWYANLVR
jgi:pimeloyl-ACP methyl ester carboxylesterase